MISRKEFALMQDHSILEPNATKDGVTQRCRETLVHTHSSMEQQRIPGITTTQAEACISSTSELRERRPISGGLRREAMWIVVKAGVVTMARF